MAERPFDDCGALAAGRRAHVVEVVLRRLGGSFGGDEIGHQPAGTRPSVGLPAQPGTDALREGKGAKAWYVATYLLGSYFPQCAGDVPQMIWLFDEDGSCWQVFVPQMHMP
jgi:hypothetical protein